MSAKPESAQALVALIKEGHDRYALDDTATAEEQDSGWCGPSPETCFLLWHVVSDTVSIHKTQAEELDFDDNPTIEGMLFITGKCHKGPRLTFKDGKLASWNMRECGLRELPDSFGRLEIFGDCDLSKNQIRTLSAGFCDITVHGDLNLGNNQLGSLECDGKKRKWADIYVDGTLILEGNPICYGELIRMQRMREQNENPFKKVKNYAVSAHYK